MVNLQKPDAGSAYNEPLSQKVGVLLRRKDVQLPDLPPAERRESVLAKAGELVADVASDIVDWAGNVFDTVVGQLPIILCSVGASVTLALLVWKLSLTSVS